MSVLNNFKYAWMYCNTFRPSILSIIMQIIFYLLTLYLLQFVYLYISSYYRRFLCFILTRETSCSQPLYSPEVPPYSSSHKFNCVEMTFTEYDFNFKLKWNATLNGVSWETSIHAIIHPNLSIYKKKKKKITLFLRF